MGARQPTGLQRHTEPGDLPDRLGAPQHLLACAQLVRPASANDFSGNDDTAVINPASTTSRPSSHDRNRRNSPTAACNTAQSAQPASTAATRPANTWTSPTFIHQLSQKCVTRFRLPSR